MNNQSGGYNPNVMGDNRIIFRENTLENALSDQIKDEIVQVITKSKRKLEQERERQEIETKLKNQNFYQKEMGYQQSIGVKKETREQQNSQNKIKDREKNNRNQFQEQIRVQQKKKENTIKDISIKQEVDMNTMATDMDTIGERLEEAGKIKGKEKEGKLAFVESDDLKKLKDENGNRLQGHSSRYEAVSIDKHGNVKALDLEEDKQKGTNPTEKNYQVKQDSQVQKGDVLTRLKVGEGSIGVEKAQYGEVEVYHSPKKTIGGNGIEGNKSLDRQLETSNAKNTAKGTDIETLKLAQEYNDGYRSVEEGYQEITKHEKRHPDCEEKEAEDLDGKKDTKSHTHPQPQEEYVELSNGEKVSYNQLATRWGFYKDGKPDSEFVKEKFGEKKKDDKKPEEVINELDEEFEDPRANNRGR